MDNIKITVIFNNTKKTYIAKKGDNLLQLLAKWGYYIPAFCGGRGTCGKCKVKLLSGKVNGAVADKDNNILSCRAEIIEDIIIEAPNVSGSGLTSFDGVLKEEIDALTGYGIALDIGTTTLAFYLIDMETGQEKEVYSTLNPQGIFGADVLSRIAVCKKGKLGELNSLIIKKVNEVIEVFLKKHNISEIEKLTVCGNTTMLHLFANIDPTPIGEYPFKPVFLERKEFTGDSLKLQAKKVILMPSITAYVGSDITSGIMSTKMIQKGRNNLLIDIGTNGEIALYAKEKLYCASTAAGPAFEGANITCGMGGVAGAISEAKYNNAILYKVIGGGRPLGICGSGLIDLIAILIENNVIDETGAFDYINCNSKLKQKMIGDKFYITEDIFISQKDIREFQLGKSAICSGIVTITTLAGLSLNDIDTIIIAGGLGFYINHDSAVTTGLIPKELKEKIRVVGNSAGYGAKLCTMSEKHLKECEQIAKNCTNIELSTESLFMSEYIKNMSF